MSAKPRMKEEPNQEIPTRWQEAIKATGQPPRMPPIILGRHLIEAFRELGYAWRTGMGEVPLPYAEIEAYARNSGGLEPREIKLLRKMSEAYCYGRNRGTDIFEQPPWPLKDEDGNEIPDDDPDLEDWEDG